MMALRKFLILRSAPEPVEGARLEGRNQVDPAFLQFLRTLCALASRAATDYTDFTCKRGGGAATPSRIAAGVRKHGWRRALASPDTTPMIDVRHLSKHFGPIVAADDVSFTVRR